MANTRLVLPAMVITDHTTAIVRSVTKGKGRASVSSQAEFKASLDRMDQGHIQLVQACQLVSYLSHEAEVRG